MDAMSIEGKTVKMLCSKLAPNSLVFSWSVSEQEKSVAIEALLTHTSHSPLILLPFLCRYRTNSLKIYVRIYQLEPFIKIREMEVNLGESVAG